MTLCSHRKRVLITGAGIAGPALACGLVRRGHDVTVVERAPALRTGGQAVDFRGAVHLQVLRELGVLDALEERRTHMGGLTFVDADDRPIFSLPPSFAGGDLEVSRGDLVDVLVAASADARYVFGDSVVAVDDDGRGVDVVFAGGAEDRFDVVVGADGLRSGIRALAFGPPEKHLTSHGYAVAFFAAPNVLGLERQGVVYSEPGRAVSVSSDGGATATVQLVVAQETPGLARPDKEALAAAVSGMGWQWPRLARLFDDVKDADLYADVVCRVDVDGFARGRVVLLGDSATGATVGGQGCGVAVVGARVLADALSAEADPAVAFRRYEDTIARWARGCQDTAKHMGPFFAPRTRAGLVARNAFYRVLTSRPLAGVFERLTAGAANDLVLPAAA